MSPLRCPFPVEDSGVYLMQASLGPRQSAAPYEYSDRLGRFARLMRCLNGAIVAAIDRRNRSRRRLHRVNALYSIFNVNVILRSRCA